MMFSKESASGIEIPIVADPVLSPQVYFGEGVTGIYFETRDEQHGRITFENLDSLKVCRGEVLPWTNDWRDGREPCWVYKVRNSRWQQERYLYERKVYGERYEFGGNVEEMLTDFSHFVFIFHDQFVEAIARGFWFEKDKESLFQRDQQSNHPLLEILDENPEKYEAHSITCQIRRNSRSKEELIKNAKFCSQKLMEFALELDGNTSVGQTLVLSYRNEKLISKLRGFFGKEIAVFDGIADFNDVRPYIENHMIDVHERRKAMGKH